ncbi:hypothetical protein QLX08_001064 [Tetragonisca angustula]|uniref:Uncharacterized protein n=1 Tax=Tetragonisca angustula TaxID=166442 RepID=A0AAW1AJV0_9HYME
MKGLGAFLVVTLVLVLLAIEDTESKKMTMDEAKKMVKNLRKSCSKKNDTPKELLDGQHKGEFPKDERLMCYMKCILIQTKAMKNDEIMFDFFVKNARAMIVDEYVERIEKVVEKCRTQVTATDGCEVAWQFGKCIYETDAEVIFHYDYTENNTLVIPSSVNNSLTTDSLAHRRSERDLQSISLRRHHLRYRRRSSRAKAMAVCRNNRNKPQCRRV